jgi:hypothetical protein
MRTGYLRHTALALCVLMAAACQTPTPYGPAVTPNGDGYTTQQIESNRFRVSFKGNSLTNRQTVDTYMLYRAAEVTLQNGGDYFVIVNKDVDKNTAYENYGDDLAWGWGGGWGWRHGGFGGAGFGGGIDYTRPIPAYDAIADVVTYRGPKPQGNANAYDAREVMNAIGPTVVRIGPAPGAPPAMGPASAPAPAKPGY